MLEIRFETWEAFDKAIPSIVEIVKATAEENNK